MSGKKGGNRRQRPLNDALRKHQAELLAAQLAKQSQDQKDEQFVSLNVYQTAKAVQALMEIRVRSSARFPNTLRTSQWRFGWQVGNSNSRPGS